MGGTKAVSTKTGKARANAPTNHVAKEGKNATQGLVRAPNNPPHRLKQAGATPQSLPRNSRAHPREEGR